MMSLVNCSSFLLLGSSPSSPSSSPSSVAVAMAAMKNPMIIPNPQKALLLRRTQLLSSTSNYFYNNNNNISISRTTTLSSSSSVVNTAVHSDQLASDSQQQQQQQEGKKKYYFVVANAKFMLDEEEHFMELLFERLRYYGERSKEQDFWLVIEPNFLDQFPDITKRLGRPAVALVSTNSSWITFMKLRLDRVLAESYEANSLEEALSSNPAVNIEFKQPQNWVAPYPKYETGWWEAFLPPTSLSAIE